MRIKCNGCGEWHDISPTAMAVAIAAFQDGDLTKVNRTESREQVGTALYHHLHGYALSSECLLKAFDDPERVRNFKQRYKGNVIMVDGTRL